MTRPHKLVYEGDGTAEARELQPLKHIYSGYYGKKKNYVVINLIDSAVPTGMEHFYPILSLSCFGFLGSFEQK